MNGSKKSKWIYGHNDEGSYIYCNNCKRRLSAKTIIFADSPYTSCPYCKKKMEEINDEILENLRSSIL